MFEFLFGMPLAARFIIAFVVVLGLIGLTAWLVRRFASHRLGGGTARGRQPRLAVIDAANVDARRRLILIRRDNIEHLLMIGGPTDIVVEPNIVRAGAAREPARESGVRMPTVDNGWPLQPLNEPPPRGRDEWSPPPELPTRARPTDPLAGLSSDFSSRLAAPEVAPLPRREPRPVPPAPAPIDPAADQNLADMANQLEAALRSLPETRSPITDAAPAKAPEPMRPRGEVKMRIDPRIEARTELKPEFKPEPRLEPRPEPKLDLPDVKVEARAEPKIEVKPEPKIEPKPEAPKLEVKPPPKVDALSRQDFYNNLEEEMASLLGRPSAKP